MLDCFNDGVHVPVTDSLEDVGVEIGSSDEDVSGEGGCVVGAHQALVHRSIPVDSIRGHFDSLK